MVSYARNKEFTGRSESIERIRELSGGDGHNRISLYGLGGAGKSQLAIEYIYRNEGLRNTFWVHGSSFLRFSQDYGSISQYIGTLHDSPGATEHKLLLKVKKWLESPASGDWILVIDNADNEDDFAGNDSAISKFVPQGSKGTIIFTTRSRVIASRQGCKVIEVGKMTDQEARMLFFTRLGSSGTIGLDDDRALGKILDALDHLPLVIVAAAACMAETNTSPEVDMTESILSTYFITYDKIKEQIPLAGDLLRLIAFFNRQNIPEELLLQSGLEGVEDEDRFREATGKLLGFSLATRAKDQPMYELHRLVHRSIQIYLSTEGMSEWRNKALEVISRLFPEYTSEQRDSRAAYFPHALAVVEDATGPVARQVGYRVGLYLREMGHYNDALAQVTSLLAYILRGLSRYEEAESTFRDVQEARSRILGPENSLTMTSLGDLALVLHDLRRYGEAEAMFRRVLKYREKALGPFHPETLKIINNIARVLHDQGRYAEAKSMFQRTTEDTEKALGPTHPQTLTAVHNLAFALRAESNHAEAETMFRRALEGREKVLGPTHPHTLASIIGLGLSLRDQEKHSEEEEMFRRALDIQEKTRGPEHVDTLESVNSLALALESQGKLEDAERMFRRALDARERVLGWGHPATIKSVNHLASMLQDQGKFDEVQELFLRGCPTDNGGQRGTLGPTHSQTLIVIHNLAFASVQNSITSKQKPCPAGESTTVSRSSGQPTHIPYPRGTKKRT
ncbi:TPR-like protein [Choiromyces venosus 120613-1]|uniref:TPR-like protein n=1 Tax=Choiromyces venosus 120613-1 TaxID=1336337 RepID=A0A3N4JTT7_9PEZI|nr:TPR-like protein [Choiromyces venosus 120613-1]